MSPHTTNPEQQDWPAWYCSDHEVVLQCTRSHLVCPHGHRYEIRHGIPRFVCNFTYADNFAVEWQKHSLTQLDSYTHTSITKTRLQRCLGEATWTTLAGTSVLECGCGAGRFTEVLLAAGANVTSIDLTAAVDVNLQNCPITEHHRIAQADIVRLPFAPQAFDIVLALGVVQHTRSPEMTISALYSHVAPGGTLVLDHYAFSLAWYTRTAPIFRQFLKRMVPDTAMAFTNGLVRRFLPVHKRVANLPVARSLVHRLSPVISYYQMYPELDDALQTQWALLDTYDTLTDWYKHFRTLPQIQRTLERLGLADICCNKAGNGIEARGRRPH